MSGCIVVCSLLRQHAVWFFSCCPGELGFFVVEGHICVSNDLYSAIRFIIPLSAFWISLSPVVGGGRLPFVSFRGDAISLPRVVIVCMTPEFFGRLMYLPRFKRAKCAICDNTEHII